MAFIYGIPFRSIIYRNVFKQRKDFIKRFSSFKFNKDESKLIRALEELFRSDEYKHLFRQHDINALHVLTLWISTSILAPMSTWAIVDLLLHPEALVAVTQEINENVSSSSTFIYDKEILAKLKILESCITETYRRVLNSNSMRIALVDTTIECLDNTKEDYSKVTRSVFDLPNICKSVRKSRCKKSNINQQTVYTPSNKATIFNNDGKVQTFGN